MIEEIFYFLNSKLHFEYLNIAYILILFKKNFNKLFLQKLKIEFNII